MKVGLQIMKNVFTPLAKNFLMSLGLMDAVAGTDAAISKKVFGWVMTISSIIRFIDKRCKQNN